MLFIERIRNLLKKKQSFKSSHSKIEAKITKEFSNLSEKERRAYLNRVFDVEFCKTSGFFEYKIKPSKRYFIPDTDAVLYNDKEYRDEALEKFVDKICH